jgi:hypothetical protein
MSAPESRPLVVASQRLSTFTRLRFGLMVGIGGCVPSEENDIRLGDVRMGSLNRPPDVLLHATVSLQANNLMEAGGQSICQK